MVSFRWLRPGLHIKRWVAVICLGMALLAAGAVFFTLGRYYSQDIVWREGAEPVRAYGLARILVPLGCGLVLAGVYRLVRRIERIYRRSDESRGLTELALRSHRLDQGPKIACLGGGTGLSTLLSGLREHSGRVTAIVSVADDGGSSGRLRQDFDMLPPGDIRNCLAALSDAGGGMRRLLQYRFGEGELAGHSFGNLYIAVLDRLHGGDFGRAVREANTLLNVRGQVLPATLDKVSLVAEHPDGTKTTGQRHIARCGLPISALRLMPPPGETPPDVLEAARGADLVVLGPGSLYTSILPVLLDPALAEAVSRSRARVALVVNILDQPGETPGFPASEYLKTLWRHVPGLRVDTAIVNDTRPSPALLADLAARGLRPTDHDAREMAGLGPRVLLRDLLDPDTPARHDPRKLAAALMETLGPGGA